MLWDEIEIRQLALYTNIRPIHGATAILGLPAGKQQHGFKIKATRLEDSLQAFSDVAASHNKRRHPFASGGEISSQSCPGPLRTPPRSRGFLPGSTPRYSGIASQRVPWYGLGLTSVLRAGDPQLKRIISTEAPDCNLPFQTSHPVWAGH